MDLYLSGTKEGDEEFARLLPILQRKRKRAMFHGPVSELSISVSVAKYPLLARARWNMCFGFELRWVA